ncbi:hypothetical protein PR202_ga24746 [Eleusine coracana subsp. coracana]|uniref:BZIP domain-containing protein n=1 Tax=Eleusine coracana subsp. coracana TaxID=191504 RepID=A0AAV5D8R4_ELECO|nr:hypothetical protein PR202_ga24746 [Eleusine coracana subsp. coracana]
MSDDSDGQRQCRRGANVDVHELDAAMALADMAGVGPDQQPQPHAPAAAAAHPRQVEDEELASTRLSLELGKVGIQSSPCSSSSSAGHHHHHPSAQQQHQPRLMPAAAVSGYGPRPRHMLTEAEKEAKRLRRVLANRESARQTILRRQAIRDELARKVADLSSQNETMKKVASRTTKKAPVSTAMQVALPSQQAATEAMAAAASPPTTPPQPSFLYTAAPPSVPVPYVWGSWPPTAAAGYEHHAAGGSPTAPLCLPTPCAWYYPVVADLRGGSPTATYPPFHQDPRPRAVVAGEPTSGDGSPAAEEDTEDTDDDPCSLTLAIDVDKNRSVPIAIGGREAAGQSQAVGSERDKAATAAEARKRRKELTKLKHMHAAGRPGGEQW